MNKMLTKALDNNLHRHFSDIEDHMNSTAKAEDPQSFPELLDFRNKFVNEFVNK